MSRVGKQPVPVPKGVDVTLGNGTISVKGMQGTLVRPLDPRVEVKQEDGRLVFTAVAGSDEADAAARAAKNESTPVPPPRSTLLADHEW